MKAAAALIRVSTQKQELDSQIEALKIEALKLGYTILDEFIFGEKITGFDGGYIKDEKGEVVRKEDRESIAELKRACEQDKDNRIKSIFVWEISRLSRKTSTLLDYVEMFNTLKKPIYFTSHNIWTLDPLTLEVNENNKLMLSILANYGEQERTKIMQRHKRGKDYAVTEKRYVGGLIPYGYDIEEINKKKYYTIHPERSEIVRDIFDKYLYDGWASDRIARYLNNKGVPTYYNFTEPDKKLKTNIGRTIERKNIRWTHTTVLNILRNPFYKGIREYKEQTVECPIIIEPEMWEKVQLRLKDNNKFGEKKRKFNYPIKDLLRCGECGSKFYGVVTCSKQTYFCNRKQLEGIPCNCNAINKYKLDAIVWNFISNTPYIYEYFKNIYTNDNDADNIKKLNELNELDNKQIIELTSRKSELLDMYKDGLYSREELNEAALDVNKSINEYQNIIKKRTKKIHLLSKQQSYKLTPEQIKKDIDDAGTDVDKISLLISMLIEKITITNLIEKRFSLIEIKFNIGNIENVNTTASLIYDQTLKTNHFYYINSTIFIKEQRKFKSIKPIIPDNVDMSDMGIAFEVLGSIEAIKTENQTLKEELINNLKVKYGIVLEYELIDVNTMISEYSKMYDFNLIEVNPFTMSNPEYAAYKEKSNKRKNDLKKQARKRKSKDYVRTPKEEYDLKIMRLHNQRSKIRKMDISDGEKEKLLNKTRIEIEELREEYKNTIS